MSRTGAALKRVLMVGVAVLGVTVSASADPITGSIGFTGAGVLTFSTGGGAEGTNYIDWCPLNGGGPLGCNLLVDPLDGAGQGRTTVGTVSTDFAVNAGTQGTILDMTDDSTPTAPYTYVPAGQEISIVGFLDFVDPYTYTLKYLDIQTCSGGEVCIGAFKLTDTGDSVTVAMSGDVWVTNGPDITLFEMTISTQFAAADIETFLQMAASPEGVLSSSWSGELRGGAPIPEPATLLTFGAGSFLLAAHRRRKAIRNRA